MATISAKFNDSESEKLDEICIALQVDKSEALRRATNQLWLTLQIGVPFAERAGGGPKHLLNSGSSSSSTKKSRTESIDDYLKTRTSRRTRRRSSSDDLA